LRAFIFGAFSFGGETLGTLTFGLQHAHESLQFYQQPTFLAIFGPSNLGAFIFGAFIFGAFIFGAIAFSSF
jgi:hypothetical protein